MATPREHVPLPPSSSQVRHGPSRGRRHVRAGAGLEGHSPRRRSVGLHPSLDAAVDDEISMMVLEEWSTAHKEIPGQQGAYDSQLLYCEAQLKKLERMTKKLKNPSPVVTAAVCDLLHKTLYTLPPLLQNVCGRLMGHIEHAIYSEETAEKTEAAHIAPALQSWLRKVPHYVVVRRQQAMLDRLEKKSTETQELVDKHLLRRRNVVELLARMQYEERHILQQWLFKYWAATYKEQKSRIEKMAQVMLTIPHDIVTPFVSWRLYVSQRRLDKARAECDAVDIEASSVANRITEVEMENDEQRKRLHESLKIASELKTQCADQQQEHSRLRRLWDATQPELLLSVLAQSLEFFFGLVLRAAKFSGLEMRQKLVGKDINALVEGLADIEEVDVETLVINWINLALKCGKTAAEGILQSGHASQDEATRLQTIMEMPNVTSFEDLCDSAALCIVYAILMARWEGRRLNVDDLWPLDERDLDLRAGNLCSVLSMLAPTDRARSLLSSNDVVNGNPQMALCLASIMLKEPLLPDISGTVDEATSEKQKQLLEGVLAKIEKFVGAIGQERMEDPSILLIGGEDNQSLATISSEQLLLRWVNVQLSANYENHRPVENFCSDLQDGDALGKLMATIAPEVASAALPSDFEERIDEVVVRIGRVTDFELLTANAILDGQSDLLASVLAQLFLARPNLETKKESLLSMHLDLLQSYCCHSLPILAEPDNAAKVMELCVELEEHWPEIMLAFQTVQDANKTVAGIRSRMKIFLGDTLVHRAHGKPRTMLDAKEAREHRLYTSLANPEIVQSIMGKETLDPVMVNRVEETLRKHFQLLRNVFRHYSTSTNSMNGGITLEGLLKLYQDAKLRSRDLAPHHLETLFNDHLDTNASHDGVLSPSNFIEVMLQCANLKFKPLTDNLADQMSHLIEDHLKPYSCQESETFFSKMAYDPKVRGVLNKHSKELHIVFQLYATMDTSTTEAMQRATTINIKEFFMFLEHCTLLDESLTEIAVQQIFEGIQQSATDDDQGAEGLDDDDELALSEFLDGLVAITAYKYPDPFMTFHKRVDTFIIDIFTALRRHWSRKRISPQVDAMVNALQKKLR